MAGSLETPNTARIPLLHSARERVTNVALLDMLVLCPLVIWRKTEQKLLMLYDVVQIRLGGIYMFER